MSKISNKQKIEYFFLETHESADGSKYIAHHSISLYLEKDLADELRRLVEQLTEPTIYACGEHTIEAHIVRDADALEEAIEPFFYS